MDKVVIVGGGLGGLLLALLLERASVGYVVLERSAVAKMPLEGGGVIAITSQIQPLLQQLGLLEAVQRASKSIARVAVLEVDQRSSRQLPKSVGSVGLESSYSRYGYYTLAISRPELYNILVDQIPSEKLLLGKQVQSIQQDDTTASCLCTDGSTYCGIIIGADGAYSSVRLSLYRQLKDSGALAAQDRQPMRYEYQTLVGMTHPLDPSRFPLIRSEHSDVRVVVSHGLKPFTFWCVPMTGNRMCWILDERLAEPQDCPEVEDWSGTEQAVQEITSRYRSMHGPLADIRLGEIFDATPHETMLSIPREEGFYSTWAHGKIVLMGDACHKALPYSGQPFVQAGYDAVKLANVLYALSRAVASDGAAADKRGCFIDVAARLRSYEAERRSEAKRAVKSSRLFGMFLSRQGWIGRMVRFVMLNYVPQFLLHWTIGDRWNRHRPLADFLPKANIVV